MFYISLLIFISFPGLLQSCGSLTHAEIGYRAVYQFKAPTKLNFQQLLLKHSDAFQAGTPFPDAFYSTICFGGKYHSISEDTHFAPFINATVNYIKKHYSQPWDEKAEKLIAFLFGITSHQVADILWHSLGIEQGFLQTMASVNFHGSFPAAHSWGDLGGDVLNAYEQNITYIPTGSDPHSWYIPTTDLFNIYMELYGHEKISENVILECFKQLYILRIAELLALPKLYNIIAYKSPFLVQQLDDFFLGGLDDMAGWTQIIWQSVAEMLVNNTSSCVIPYNTLCLQCTKHKNKNIVCNKSSSENGIYRSIPPASLAVAMEAASDLHLTPDDIHVQKTAKGVFMEPSINLKERLQNAKVAVPHFKKISSNSRIQLKPYSLYTVNNSYSKFGWSLTTGDVDNDGFDDLVIGAPGYGTEQSPQQGCIFVIYGNESGILQGHFHLDSLEAFSCGLPKNQSRFGTSVVILDLNVDGIKDVVVGAPSSNNFPSLEYQGEVFVFLGEKMKRRTSRKADMVIKCSKHIYCNVGWKLNTADINGDGQDDLLISTPFFAASGSQRGCVASLLAHAHLKAAKTMEFDQMDWIQCGSQDFGWFGYSMAVSKENIFSEKPGKLLAIGEPTYRICEFTNCTFSSNDHQGIGRVHLYFLGIGGMPVYLSDILGPKMNLSQFGSSLAFGKPFQSKSLVLAVGATSNNVKGSDGFFPMTLYQAGTVYLLNVSTFYQNDLIATFSGDRFVDLFGMELQFSDVNRDNIDDFVITSPFYKKKILSNSGVESGHVYIYYGGDDFPTGNVTSQCKHTPIVPCPGEKASLQISGDEEKARFGNAFAVYKTKRDVFLVISSTHSNAGDRLSGSVTLYRMPQ